MPWAREGGGFTLLFEALVMALVSAMPVNAVARLVGEHDTKLWRVIHHYVERARARTNLATVTRVAIDETAALMRPPLHLAVCRYRSRPRSLPRPKARTPRPSQHLPMISKAHRRRS